MKPTKNQVKRANQANKRRKRVFLSPPSLKFFPTAANPSLTEIALYGGRFFLVIQASFGAGNRFHSASACAFDPAASSDDDGEMIAEAFTFQGTCITSPFDGDTNFVLFDVTAKKMALEGSSPELDLTVAVTSANLDGSELATKMIHGFNVRP